MSTTSLTVREMRAQIVQEQLTAHPVPRAEDIGRLPRLTGWAPHILDVAIADLVADGAITEDSHGRLVLTPARQAVS